MSIRVPGFSPAVNGFHFPNAFPPNPIRQFSLGNIASLNVGDVANGLCGGMSFAIRDLFEHGLRPPPDLSPPTAGTPQHAYIVDRQIDSFQKGVVPLRFFKLMSPDRPAREPLWAQLLGLIGIDRHSRTYGMVKVEWPAIRADLDAGRLPILGLVRVIGRDLHTLGLNHQVVAYGYDLEGSIVTLHIADPNWPDDEDVTLSFDTADARGEIQPVWSKPGDRAVVSFFRAPYEARPPDPFR
jgi:hypothetical protein